MLNIIKNTINRVFASGVDSDASAFITATGLSGTTQKSAITTLVKDLKSSGLWSKMKAVYPMVTDNRNLFSYTQDTSNAYWGKNNLTLTQNVANPFGANTAYLMTENSSSGYHVMYSGVVATTALSTYSCYLKSNGRQWAWLSDNAGGVYFDLVNGVVGTASGGRTGSITNIGNGWYRCVVSNNAISGGNQYYISLSLNGADSGNYTGNGTSGIYVYGNQLELGSTASTYQPILTTPAAFMASQMKYNLKDARDLDAAFRLSWSGGWTYSTNGAQPNGTNGWANTNLNPVGLINGTNSHMSYYSRTDNDGLYADLGHGGSMELLTRFGNVYYADYPDSTRAQVANSSSLGNFIISNTSAGGKKVFKNASTLISSAFVNVNFSGVYTVVIANFNNLVPSRYSNRQFSFVTIGDGLTDAEAAILYQLTQQHQTDLSRQV